MREGLYSGVVDNGVIFYLLLFGPLLPVVIAVAGGIFFALGAAVHALIGGAVSSFVEYSRPRRERAYVKKHQRGISHL